MVIQKLLNLFIISKNLELLEVSIVNLSMGKHHYRFNDWITAMSNYMSNLTLESSRLTFEWLDQLIDGSFSELCVFKACVLDNVVLKAFDGISYEVFIAMAQTLLPKVLRIIEQATVPEVDTNQLKVKAVCFKIITLCYRYAVLDDIHTKNGRIMSAIKPDAKSDNELAMGLIKIIQVILKRKCPPPLPHTDVIEYQNQQSEYQYQQYAYNCFSEIFFKTQTKVSILSSNFNH
jgi:hypothetical protein